MLPPPNLRPEELLARLSEISDIAETAATREFLLERAVEKLQDLLGAEGVTIFPVRAAQRIDSPGARVLHLPPRLEAKQQAEFGQAKAPVMFTARKYRVLDIPAEISDHLDSIWMPIMGKGQHDCTLAIFRTPAHPFTEMDRELTRMAAAQLSLHLRLSGEHREASSGHMPPEQFAGWQAIGANLINPLTALGGYLDLLRQEPLSEKCRQFVEKMQVQMDKLEKTATRISGQWSAAPEAEAVHPLPVKPAVLPSAIHAPISATMPGPAAGRVMLIQPNAAVAQYAMSVLCAMGMEVAVETTLAAGVDALFSDRTDALILDETLFQEHAHELQELMSSNPRIQQKRILVTVSAGANLPLSQYFEAIPKPLSFQAIRSGLQAVLGSRAQDRSKVN